MPPCVLAVTGDLLFQVLEGIVNRFDHALMALGLNLIWSITHVPDFSQGGIYVITAYVSYFALAQAKLPSSSPAAAIASRRRCPSCSKGHLVSPLAAGLARYSLWSIALFFLLANVAIVLWTPKAKILTAPRSGRRGRVRRVLRVPAHRRVHRRGRFRRPRSPVHPASEARQGDPGGLPGPGSGHGRGHQHRHRHFRRLHAGRRARRHGRHPRYLPYMRFIPPWAISRCLKSLVRRHFGGLRDGGRRHGRGAAPRGGGGLGRGVHFRRPISTGSGFHLDSTSLLRPKGLFGRGVASGSHIEARQSGASRYGPAVAVNRARRTRAPQFPSPNWFSDYIVYVAVLALLWAILAASYDLLLAIRASFPSPTAPFTASAPT